MDPTAQDYKHVHMFYTTRTFPPGSCPIQAYGNAWEVRVGRVDRPVLGTNKVPAADAPVEEIRVSGLAVVGESPGCGWREGRRSIEEMS